MRGESCLKSSSRLKIAKFWLRQSICSTALDKGRPRKYLGMSSRSRRMVPLELIHLWASLKFIVPDLARLEGNTWELESENNWDQYFVKVTRIPVLNNKGGQRQTDPVAMVSNASCTIKLSGELGKKKISLPGPLLGLLNQSPGCGGVVIHRHYKDLLKSLQVI